MPDAEQPLVSCVMPTTARRRLFVPQAIRYFQQQDYPNKELLVVDDGVEPIADVVPEDPQVRYIRLEGTRTLGTKRNLCVEAASADLIMHWDDDDWISSKRISYQMEALLRAGAEICGQRQMIFYELASGRAWLYEYPAGQRPWLAGGSLLYTREFWSRSPFPDVQVASDTRFIWSQRLDRSVVVPHYDFYVAMIHPENTSKKNCRGSYWSPWPGSVQSVMGADYAFYEPFLTKIEKSHLFTSGKPTIPPQPVPPATVSVPQEAKQRENHASAAKESDSRAPGLVPMIRSAGRRPKVSCILAAGNRPGFTRQVIRCFLRQTFADAELVVVDDGEQSVAELCAGLFRVRYVRLDEPTVLGRKLNIGIEQASGVIMQKLDHRGFYQQDFLARSVSTLQTAKEEGAIVTWDCFTVFLAEQRQLRFSGHGWTAGGTLCFRHSLWEQLPFRDEQHQVDDWFIQDHQTRPVKVCAPELYTIVRHGRNTKERLSNGVLVDDYFKFLPSHDRKLEDLIEPIDRPFYQALANGGGQ